MQRKAEEAMGAYQLDKDILNRYVDVTSEVGELGKALLTASNYGKDTWRADRQVCLELGDCIFSLLALCSALEIDAEAALELALGKYRARFEETGGIGSGGG